MSTTIRNQLGLGNAESVLQRAYIECAQTNPSLPKDRIDEVAIAATTQTGDQGLTLGRTAALLAGLPKSVPGYALDRMCAGAMTTVTTIAGAIAFGAYDVGIAGGVEHMGRHPMGFGADPNPRCLSEKLVSADALNMGNTAERIHDRFPQQGCAIALEFKKFFMDEWSGDPDPAELAAMRDFINFTAATARALLG